MPHNKHNEGVSFRDAVDGSFLNAPESVVLEERENLDKPSKPGRFVFTVTCIAIIDLCAFGYYETWSAPVCITMIEVILIIALAEIWEQKSISAFIKSAVSNLSRPRKD